MRRQPCRLACLLWSFLLLVMVPTQALATDHFNLEWGIPTSLEDIVALERGSFELQGFGRYLRLKGKKNAGLAQPRLAYGIFENTQLEIESPFLLGQGEASGNGDVQISILRMLRADRQGAWRPGVALEADVSLPTGAETHGFKNRIDAGLAQPRMAYGIFENTQLEIETPLLLGQGAVSGNGDIQASLLRMLWTDRRGSWRPGVALEADVSLPTGVATHGFTNRTDAGFTLIMKKDAGPHSFHFNAEFDWTRDQSEEEHLRNAGLSIAVGHDMPLTKRVILVSDVVWRQSDEKGERDVRLFETGVRAQLTRSLIGAIGVGIGLNRGAETPAFSLTVGFQLGL